MNRLTDQRGQVMTLTVLFIIALCGMAALVLDVGSWFREQRELQQVADAAALAGAQALPEDSARAEMLAHEYVTKNDGPSPEIGFSSSSGARTDTISVRVQRPAEGFFARVFNIDSVTVSAKAAARASNPNSARWAAPIGVDERHPLLACEPLLSCFGPDNATELDMDKVGPGAFRLLNLDHSHGGTGPSILAAWLLSGFDGYMPLGQYNSDPGAKFNSHEVLDALDQRLNTEMLFPVYRTIREEGANLEYEVIGWVGFMLTSYAVHGNSGTIYGHFTRVIWEGIQNESASEDPDFGVRSIQLIE
jgi:hypothetical protein